MADYKPRRSFAILATAALHPLSPSPPNQHNTGGEEQQTNPIANCKGGGTVNTIIIKYLLKWTGEPLHIHLRHVSHTSAVH
jgi:hypothetical protein